MSDTIKIEGSAIVIVRTKLWGGGINYCAYEPSVGGYASTSHSSLFRIGETVYGAVATRRLTAELDKLPAGNERYNAVHAYIEQNKRTAEGAIALACPEAAEHGVCTGGGDITVYPKAVRS